eukprot:gnl/TRDRNA2_/TRDRNA2_133469_c0_seq1.p1 gnl/TRDRNA2_/TRDRNA2_133469_c0~~gnl/TRDRNA2_/TRDRNA2_133469_c0_seq1.p1  ORF type:complete len:301 (+),score=50.27 gnl/TRDRNA2_/TRDRNA2_133469_c0_seq1:97-999(+)
MRVIAYVILIIAAVSVVVFIISAHRLMADSEAKSMPRKQTASLGKGTVPLRDGDRPQLSSLQAACDQVHQPGSGQYNLTSRPDSSSMRLKSFSQIRQDLRLAQVLSSANGFFIESGAADGETDSNTLHFEMKGWTGLLVEPNPRTFLKLLSKHRKAYSYNGALSTTGEFGTMNLQLEDCYGPGKGDGECSTIVSKQGINTVEVQVAPLDKLLACLKQTTVDLWSLDVEGVESMVLDQFPFHEVEVGLLLIEMNKSENNNKQIEDIMKKQGFQECGQTTYDRIYMNPSYFLRRGLETPSQC